MYESATKEELIEKVQQLERHVVQLKNVIAKSPVSSHPILHFQGSNSWKSRAGDKWSSTEGVVHSECYFPGLSKI